MSRLRSRLRRFPGRLTCESLSSLPRNQSSDSVHGYPHRSASDRELPGGASYGDPRHDLVRVGIDSRDCAVSARNPHGARADRDSGRVISDRDRPRTACGRVDPPQRVLLRVGKPYGSGAICDILSEEGQIDMPLACRVKVDAPKTTAGGDPSRAAAERDRVAARRERRVGDADAADGVSA